MSSSRPVCRMTQVSNGALKALIQNLLQQGVSARKIADRLDVSGARLVEVIAGKGENGADAIIPIAVPMEVGIAPESVSVSVGAEPRWQLSVSARSHVPTVRAQAPYLDVSLDMRGEELVAREATRSARPRPDQ